MTQAAQPIIPPAPRVHPKPLPTWMAVVALLRDPLTIYSEADFERTFSRTRGFGRESVGLNDPAFVRHVLTTSFAKYRRPVAAVRTARPIFGGGVFLAEGDEWRRQRRMLAPVFTPAHVGEFLPHFQAAALTMLKRLAGRTEANLSAEFNRATLDSVLRALFSTPADTQGAELAALVRAYLAGPGLPKLWDAFARHEGDFALLDRSRRRAGARWFAAVDALVAERRAAAVRTEARDLLDVLLAARDPETGAHLPPEEVRDQTATMLFAGFETTTRLLFWTAHLLALDQLEQERIREEIAAFPPEQVADLADFERWPRLRRALLESLRLYPPVGLMVRECVERDEVAGEVIEPGTLVWISPWTLHRHRKHWRDPTAFVPERWIDQPQPWTQGPFMPFGGGPRICIGAGFAMAEAQVLMASLLARWRFALADERPVLPKGAVTTVPDHEPRFALTELAP